MKLLAIPLTITHKCLGLRLRLADGCDVSSFSAESGAVSSPIIGVTLLLLVLLPNFALVPT